MLSHVLSRSISFRRHAEPGVHTPGSPGRTPRLARNNTPGSPGIELGFAIPHSERTTNSRCVNVRGAVLTPPSTAVPVPKGMIGTRCTAHSRTVSATSFVHDGKTTASGGCGLWCETSWPCSSRVAVSVENRSPNRARSDWITCSQAGLVTGAPNLAPLYTENLSQSENSEQPGAAQPVQRACA